MAGKDVGIFPHDPLQLPGDLLGVLVAAQLDERKHPVAQRPPVQDGPDPFDEPLLPQPLQPAPAGGLAYGQPLGQSYNFV